MKPRYRHTEELIARHRELETQIRNALDVYKAVPRSKYFYELCYCLMTPQSSAANAADAQARLEDMCFYETDTDPEPILRRPEYYIRFHKTKARRLVRAKTALADVLSVLDSGISACDKREWLASQIDGLSYKEATHFLRNIGMNGGLAILDVHILRRLVKHGVIDEVPAALTKGRYLAIEERFQRFAESIAIPIDELDLVFWSGATGFILK
jgi:N-glycosylase/DNA lyase